MTSFFKQSYTRVNEVSGETTAKVLISMLDGAFSKNSLSISEDSYTNFTLIMEGPFISFIKKRSISQGISHDHVHSYIFSPHYMVKRNLFNYSIHFIPNNHLINSSIDIVFSSEIDCKIWYEKIIKIRKILKDGVKIIPPVLTNSSLYIPQIQIPITCEMSIMNGQISFHGSERNPSIPKPIKITKDISIISTYESDLIPSDARGLSFAISGKGIQDIVVCVGSTDLLEFSFMTIFSTIEELFRAKPRSPPVSFAAAIPARKAALLWPSPSFVSPGSAFECRLNSWAPRTRTDGVVAVPEKAASHLEILVFDAPISRRVIACRASKDTQRRPPPVRREDRPSFADQAALLAPPLSLAPAAPRTRRPPLGAPFSPRAPLCRAAGPALSEAARAVLAAHGIEAVAAALPGEAVAAELSRRVSEVPLAFDAGGPEFAALASLVGSVVALSPPPPARGVLAAIAPRSSASPFELCATLFARCATRGRLREFVEWALAGASPGTLLAAPEFAELFVAALRPMRAKEGAGRLRAEALREEAVADGDDNAVRALCARLLRELQGGRDVRECAGTVALIVSHAAAFLCGGFRPPSCAPVPALARPWASAASAAEGDDLALRAAVERLSLSAPGSEMSRLVLTGLRCGRAAQWVAAVSARMRREGSAAGALLEDRRVAGIVDALLSVSGVFIDLTDDDVLSTEGLLFV